MAESSERPRVSWLAIVAGLVGLATLPILPATGPLVLVLGWLGLRSVNAREESSIGRAAALLAILLGSVGTALTAVGLVAVVIQRMRVSAERAECANHLRLIGEAVQLSYDNSAARDAERSYPPAAIPHPNLEPESRLSWFVAILPYLNSRVDGGRWQTLYGRVRDARPWGENDDTGIEDVRVRLFFCPAQPGDLPREHPGFTSYVGFAGINPGAVSLPVHDPRAGMFGYGRVVQVADVSAGTSYTLLASETTVRNGSWLTATSATFRGIEPDAEHYLGPALAFGGCHPGGANSLRVDGSVPFLRDAIHPRVFQSLVTLAEDGAVDAP